MRLLVVDDDETMRMLVHNFFLRAAPDIEIVEAVNGEQALEILSGPDGAFDCVLSDYRMGIVTGTDVLAFTMTRHPRTARVLISGFADPNMVRGAKERARVHACLEKPMRFQELEALLRDRVLLPFLRNQEHLAPLQ